jgi:hypothetical protein
MIAISAKINHNPLLIRNMLSSFFVLRRLCRYIDVPERKTKTGAQKCVIHRVKNNVGDVVARFNGSSKLAPIWK